MKRMWFAAVALLSAGLLSGCRGLGMPNIFSPGSEDYQRWRAEKFDPYPDPNLGGSMAGTRPPGFENPKPEILRTQPQVPYGP